jgi:hypothetical protein
MSIMIVANRRGKVSRAVKLSPNEMKQLVSVRAWMLSTEMEATEREDFTEGLHHN